MADTSTGKEKSSRKLRSKVGSTKKSANLFQFEVNGLLYKDQRMAVRNSTSYDNLYSYYNDMELPTVYGTRDIQLVGHFLPQKPKQSDDCLSDEVFDTFYRKMKKEEKVMTNEERLRISNEVDNLQTQIDLLNRYDWIRHLPEITQIDDPQDYEELESKRDLTIQEIENQLRKHEEWKKRAELLNSDIKEFEGNDHESDEYTSSFEVLMERRRKERAAKYGPVIKLRLNNGYTLIIDQILPPKIVRTSTMDNTVIKPGHKLPKPAKVVTKNLSDSKPITKRRKSSYVDKSRSRINLQIHPEHNIIFGTHFGDLSPRQEGYKLPRQLKKAYEEKQDLRKSFRSQLHTKSND